MSVQKFKPVFEDGILKHEPKPYTQILNKVLQECTNSEALGVWCYLQSRPENWVLSPQHLQNHFKIGRDKIYKIINYLIKSNLLIRVREIYADGTYAPTDYIIRNGEVFSNPLTENKDVVNPLPGLPDTDYPDTVNQYTTNKRENINKKENKKKREGARKKRVPLPDNFAFDEKRLQLSAQIACKVGLSAKDLEDKFRAYAKDCGKISENWDAAFEKFLLDERPRTNKPSTIDKKSTNELRCTVPDCLEVIPDYRTGNRENAMKHISAIKLKLHGGGDGSRLAKGKRC